MIKPILFNTEMVQAILNGSKTVTRRIIKPQPKGILCYTMAGNGHGKWTYPSSETYRYWGDKYKLPDDFTDDDKSRVWTPPCHTDDILYVRETWQYAYDMDINDQIIESTGRYLYYADDSMSFSYWIDPDTGDLKDFMPWKPSIHMPKAAARIFLRVTNVSVTKLQDITEEQAKAEGVRKIYDDMTDEEYKDFMRRTPSENPNKKKEDWGYDNYLWHGYRHIPNYKIEKWDYQYSAYESARDSFSSLWQLTIKREDEARYSWSANPWVWVIEFERTGKPNDWI